MSYELYTILDFSYNTNVIKSRLEKGDHVYLTLSLSLLSFLLK